MNNNQSLNKIFKPVTLLAIAVTLAACGGSGGNSGGDNNNGGNNNGGNGNMEPPKTETEYVADEASFASYTTWTNVDYALGASNPFIGTAHQAGNQEFARSVFANDMAKDVPADQYPVGAVLVKETFTTMMGEKAHADMGGVLAMVKRGGDFNPDHGGWEWFMLTPEGGIAARGADLMDGACNACHAKGEGDNGVDYTFNKPSEFVASDMDFMNYQDWTLVEESTGDSPANGGAHTVNATRKTYKKQGSASPYFEAGEYPVGTVIVKEIIRPDGSMGSIYGMVKRGGDFSPASNGWEWFLLDGNSSISSRSEGGGLGFCTSCHGKAGDAASVMQDDSFRGIDMVFYKENDPVPLKM